VSGGRILAVDFGSKNLGLAVSDPTGLIAQGLPTLKRTNRRADLVRLRELVEALGVERILVGHPVHLKGYAGERARQAARFADWLRRELRLPVELVDERLTSVEADNLLRERGASKSERKQARDRVAAALLLQTWLDQQARVGTAARTSGES